MRRSANKLFYAILCIVTFSYHEASAQFPSLIPYRKANKWGFANANKKIIIEPIYDSVAIFSEGRAAVMKAKKWGYIDESGKEIVALKYDRANAFKNRKAMVAIAKYAFNLWGCIDWSGKVIIEPAKYHSMSELNNGLFKVSQSTLFGLLNKDGVEILPPTYHRIYDFIDGIAPVEKNKGNGYIDSTGKEIIKPKASYVEASHFSDGLGLIKEKEYSFSSIEYFFVEKTGKIAHNSKKYIDATKYEHGLSRVSFKQGSNYITRVVDVSGNELFGPDMKFGIAKILPEALVITDYIYPAGYKSGENMLEDYKKGVIQYGVADKKGILLKEPVYEKIEHLFGDWLTLLKNGKWQLYNCKTNKIFGNANGYDAIRLGLFDRSIDILVNKKWGTMGMSGQQKLSAKYDSVMTLNDGNAVVGNAGKFGYADAKGKEIVALKYQMIFDMENGVGFFAINDKVGIVNSKGKEIIPAKYDLRKYKISNDKPEMLIGYGFNQGIALVKMNGKAGYVDYTGKEYWED